MRVPATLALLLATVALAGCAQPAADAQALDDGGSGDDAGPMGSSDRAPAATLQATPSSGRAPLEVVFSLSARDPEGQAVKWRLDFGDRTPVQDGSALPVAVRHTYQGTGTWSVTFEASDGANTAVAKVTIRASLTQTEQGPPTTASSTPTSTSTTTAEPPPPPPPPPPSSTTSSSASTSTSPSPTSSSSSSTGPSPSSTATSSSSSTTTTSTSTSASSTTTSASSTSSSTSPTSDPTSSTSQTSTSSSTSMSETQTSAPPDNGTAPP